MATEPTTDIIVTNERLLALAVLLQAKRDWIGNRVFGVDALSLWCEVAGIEPKDFLEACNDRTQRQRRLGTSRRYTRPHGKETNQSTA